MPVRAGAGPSLRSDTMRPHRTRRPAMTSPLSRCSASSVGQCAVRERTTRNRYRSGVGHASRTFRFQEDRPLREVIALCSGFAKAHPGAVRCNEFGTTPEGRPMKVSWRRRPVLSRPEAARWMHLPVLLVQAASTPARSMAGRRLPRAAPGARGKAARVHWPRRCCCSCRYSTFDGHERSGAWNRPNQRAPPKWAGVTPIEPHSQSRLHPRQMRRR